MKVNKFTQNAKDLFYAINTTRSNDGNEILDAEELKLAKKCGLSNINIDFSSENAVSEQEFIEKYIDAAEKASTNEIRQECFEDSCENIKQCYEDLKKYGQLQFGLDGTAENKSLEVSMCTILRVPKEGMYTMFLGYKIEYTKDGYICPDREEWGACKNILELRFYIKNEVSNEKFNNFSKKLQESNTREEKETAVKEFVEDLPTWRDTLTQEHFKINGIKGGNHSFRIKGLDIYYTVGEDYNPIFNIGRILDQIP